MKNTLETRLGIFFVLAVIAGVLVLEMSGLDWFKKGYALHGDFRDVHELEVGDPVKMAGVKVGKVDGIDLDGDQVRVRLRIDEAVQIKTSSIASIHFAGLMGQNFVAIAVKRNEEEQNPNRLTFLQPGSLIKTREQADLNQMMARMDNVARGIENITQSFTGVEIDSVVGPIADFLKHSKEPMKRIVANMEDMSASMKTVATRVENGEGTVGKLIADDSLHGKLASLTENLEKISTQIASGKGTVGRMIAEDTLYNSLNDGVKTFQRTAGKIEGFVDETQALVGDARKAVNTINGTVVVTRTLIEDVQKGQGTLGMLVTDKELYTKSTAVMEKLSTLFDKTLNGEGTIGKLFTETKLYDETLDTLRNARTTMQKLDNATETMEDQGPISVIGVVFNGLF